MLGLNLGNLINVFTDTFSLSEKVIAYERYSNTFRLVQTAQLSGFTTSSTLPFSAFSQAWGWGLILPGTLSGINVRYYYDFYRFVNTTNGVYYDNIINWNDILTTSALSSVTYNNWVADNGVMDQLISRGLVQGLNLLP